MYLYEEQHKKYFIITFPNFQNRTKQKIKTKIRVPLYQRHDGKAPVSFNQPGEHHRHRDSSLRWQAITHGSPEEEGGTWGAVGSGRRQAQQQKAFIRVSNLPI